MGIFPLMEKKGSMMFAVGATLITLLVSAGSMLVLPSVADAGTCAGYPQECRERESVDTGNVFCDCPDENGEFATEADGDQLQEPTTDPNLLEGIFSLILQVVVIILYLILFLSNFLLWLAGMLFNTVFVETVLQFGQNFGNSSGVLAAWTVLRDLGNIFLLFSFVFMGIATILNLHDYTVKKTLPRLIIFAVLLNFSLFAAEAVVDVSNGVSSAIIGQTIPDTVCVEGALDAGRFVETFQTGDSPAERCARQFGITGLVMNNSHLSSVLNLPAYQDLDSIGELDTTLKQVATLFGLSLFSSILSVVFFAAAIMLLIRVIVLTFIIVTAPIGFAGMAVPFMGSIAQKWWHELVNQAFFVPIFLLLVFVGLKVVEGSGLNGAGGKTITDAIGSGDINAFSIIVTFAVTAGFFLAALMVAKRFGAYGADFAIKTAGGLTYGSMGFAGRHTFGRGATNIASAMRRSGLADNEWGRRAALVLDKAGTSSFDFRGGTLSKVASGIAGVDLGKTEGGGAKGYIGAMKADKERKLEYSESLEEEKERKYKQLKEKHDIIKEEMEGAQLDGDMPRLANLQKQLDAHAVIMEQNHEGALLLRLEKQVKLKKQIAELDKAAKSSRSQEADAKARANNEDLSVEERAAAREEAAGHADAALLAEKSLKPLTSELDKLDDSIMRLRFEIRQDKLRYTQNLVKSNMFGGLFPAGDRTNLEVAGEARRLASRTKDEEREEKLYGVLKHLTAGGGHGGPADGGIHTDIATPKGGEAAGSTASNDHHAP